MSAGETQNEIIVNGSTPPSEWGYYVDTNDNKSGDILDRQWVDDKKETIKIPDQYVHVDTDVAPDATLTINYSEKSWNPAVVVANVAANTDTTVNINGSNNNDVFAPSTRDVAGPRPEGAARPTFNINGGEGEDTIYVDDAPAADVVIQRTGDKSYKITDGTGTEYNITDTEFLKGREEDKPKYPKLTITKVDDQTYRVSNGTHYTDYDMSGIIDGPLPELDARDRGAQNFPSVDLPPNEQGIELDRLGLKVGEGTTLEQALAPGDTTKNAQLLLIDTLGMKLFNSGQIDRLPSRDLAEVAALMPENTTEKQNLSPQQVEAVRSEIESRGPSLESQSGKPSSDPKDLAAALRGENGFSIGTGGLHFSDGETGKLAMQQGGEKTRSAEQYVGHV